MSEEKEHIVKKVGQVKNTFNKYNEVEKPATRYLTYAERLDRQEELKQIEDVLNQPPWVRKEPEIIQQMKRRRVAIEKQLDSSAPPTDLKGETKDALYKRKAELENIIRQGMLPREVMRRNPPGAVGQNIRWLNATKNAQLEWKNIQRLLEPDSEDEDLANVDMLRPSMVPQNGSTFMADAQIPGHFAPGAGVSDERWENTFGHLHAEGSPLVQAEKKEEIEIKVLSPDEKEALEKEIAELKMELKRRKDAEDEIEAKKQKAIEIKERRKEYARKYQAARKAQLNQPNL